MIELDQIPIVGLILPGIEVDSRKEVFNVAVFTFWIKIQI